jgi:hypothetical protein
LYTVYRTPGRSTSRRRGAAAAAAAAAAVMHEIQKTNNNFPRLY